MQRRTLVLAEVGSNHNGDLGTAMQLIDAAKDAGADLVKFQLIRRADELMHPTHPGSASLSANTLDGMQHRYLQQYAAMKGIPYFATPVSSYGVRRLNAWKVPYIKIASGDVTNIPLIQHAASTGIPLIISVGFTTEPELQQLKAALPCKPFAVLHCVGAYPADISDVNLFDICDLAIMFDCRGGLSDHTRSIILPSIAVAYGADVIEKHLTLSRAEGQVGLDHGHSLEPQEFKQMVAYIREAEQLRLQRQPFACVKASEEAMRTAARRGVYFRVPMHKGHKIHGLDVAFLRPFNGMHPYEVEKYYGRTLARAVDQDESVTPGCFEDVDHG